MHAERRHLDAERRGVRMQGGFGGIVDGAPGIGDASGDGADLDNGAVGATEEGEEELAEADDGEEVGGEDG